MIRQLLLALLSPSVAVTVMVVSPDTPSKKVPSRRHALPIFSSSIPSGGNTSWLELSIVNTTSSPGSRSKALNTPRVSSGQRFIISLSINPDTTGGLLLSSTWMAKICLDPN